MGLTETVRSKGQGCIHSNQALGQQGGGTTGHTAMNSVLTCFRGKAMKLSIPILRALPFKIEPGDKQGCRLAWAELNILPHPSQERWSLWEPPHNLQPTADWTRAAWAPSRTSTSPSLLGTTPNCKCGGQKASCWGWSQPVQGTAKLWQGMG